MFQVKVMRYQDELEAGRRSRKPEFSIAEQVEQYRRKQLRKVVTVGSFLVSTGLHHVHEMWTIVIDDPGVCQLVCRMGRLCKNVL